jgi:peroxiredoxin Q/BCP
VIDSKGIVRSVATRLQRILTYSRFARDSMDATMNYNGHIKFVQKWLDALEAEGAQAQLSTS